MMYETSQGNGSEPISKPCLARLMPTDGTVLDLFSGAAGGWSLGMHRAGYRTVAFCELDPWRHETFLTIQKEPALCPAE